MAIQTNNDFLDALSYNIKSAEIYNKYKNTIDIISTPMGHNNWYDEFVNISPYGGNELIAKDYTHFIPMFEFYYDKFIKEDIKRMVIYAPRRSGKTRFLIELLENNPKYHLGCMNHRVTNDLVRNIETITDVRDRIFNTSIYYDRSNIREKRDADVVLFDEILPPTNVNRWISIKTPNLSRNEYIFDPDILSVNLLLDYPKHLEESRRIKYLLPEELFEI